RPGKKENKLGMRVSDTAELVLEDCRVPSFNILGQIGYGFIDAMKVLDGGRISIGALAVGIARGAYEAARGYAKQRTAFGKPIAERDDPDADRLLAEIYPSTGGARIIGITGSPGAGKSTLVAALAKHYRAQKKRVGIIAVDPTSPFTGGAILGDRIRMADLYTD